MLITKIRNKCCLRNLDGQAEHDNKRPQSARLPRQKVMFVNYWLVLFVPVCRVKRTNSMIPYQCFSVKAKFTCIDSMIPYTNALAWKLINYDTCYQTDALLWELESEGFCHKVFNIISESFIAFNKLSRSIRQTLILFTYIILKLELIRQTNLVLLNTFLC